MALICPCLRRLFAVGLLAVCSAAWMVFEVMPLGAATCGFSLGFATLHNLLPEIVGDCLQNEWHQAESGDALQQTTGGLLVWRKSDNWTAFTNGSTTWINGPDGLVSRPNRGPFFAWEGQSATPAYPEIRPENAAYNRTPGRPADPKRVPLSDSFRPYYLRIDGAFTGTTEQILEWAASKWGFDQFGYPDLAKAMAVKESKWRQSAKGDYQTGCPEYCAADYQSYGILQVKRSVWPGSYPLAAQSTAFNADYAMAVVRMHYDGNSWLGDGTRGSIRNAVAAWFCGCKYAGQDDYANQVFTIYEAKPWKRPGQPPENF